MGGRLADIVAPSWGLGLDDMRVTRWLKGVGDDVEGGEVIAILETDKAEGELAADASGRIAEIVAGEGDEVVAGDVLARIELA